MAKAEPIPTKGAKTAQPQPKPPTLGIDGNATNEPVVTRNQEYSPTNLDPLEAPTTEPTSDSSKTSKAQRSTSRTKTQVRSKDTEGNGDIASSEMDCINTPPIAQAMGEQGQGDDLLSGDASGGNSLVESLESLPLSRARDGETRKQCWERLRQEARTAGMTRRDAISYAGRAVDQVWIAPLPPEPETVEVELPEQAPVESIAEPAPVEPPPSPIPSDQGVIGLGTLPDSWGVLPANASLQAEISWVSANRLRVRDGSGVDLSKALSPAPSYSALSWLETSILFPSKFADISVKATANQDDEKEAIRREKLSIEEIRGLLAEMLEG